VPSSSQKDIARRQGPANALVHVTFVITGLVTTMLGPLLPLLAARWRLSDFAAGYLFAAQFLSSLITAAASGIFIDRLGYRWSLFCSLILMAIGAAMLDQNGWQMGMTAVCIYGAGFGLSTPTGNLLIAELNPEKRAAALNLVNFSWGIGAVGAPIAVAALQRINHPFWIGYIVIIAAAATALFTGLTKFEPIAVSRPVKNVQPTNANFRNFRHEIYLALVLCVLFFTYVGTEASIGGWVATHAHRLSFGVSKFWPVVPSFYWGFLLLGRASAPLFLKKMHETRLAIAGLIVALAGTIFVLAAHAVGFVTAGTCLAGLGLSSVYPANLSLLSEWFGNRAPRVGSFTFPAASLGGAVLPWLVGAVSTYSGGLHRGLMVPCVGVALMLGLYLLLPRSLPAQAS
jgi:MFS transporter, FHS family, glucose/mannose:H+ symporter